MSKKLKGWDKPTGVIRRDKPLKERVDETIYRLKGQLSKLDMASMKMEQHEKELFEKCVAAQAMGDDARASLYANECAEVRKISKLLLKSKLALEHVLLRLETVEEFGDVITVMGPVAGVITALRKQLGGIVPEVSYELGRIGDELGKMVVEVGEASGQRWDLEPMSTEAQKILAEASALAEQKLKERLPELPSPESEHVRR
jgi:division protein CdvB (Snf7/Vps24/ESCRT-III family)